MEITAEKAVEDILTELADALITKYNPCLREGNKCRAGSPIPCCNRTLYKRDDPSDVRCKYIGENGCEFPNLHCKIWMCKTAMKGMDPKCLQAFYLVESLAKLFGLDKRPHLGERYVNHHLF